MSLVPRVWTHKFQTLKLVDQGTSLQPKTPKYELKEPTFRCMLENAPQTQMISRMGIEIAFTDKMYCQPRSDRTISPWLMREAYPKVNDRIRIVEGRRPSGEDMSGEEFLVVEQASDNECFDTFYLERLT